MDSIKKHAISQNLHLFSQRHPTTGDKGLAAAAAFWFSIAFTGHLIFVLYIVALYGVSLIQGDFERWNAMMPVGYTEGDITGNIFIGLHLLLAAIISIGGPLQIIPKLRAWVPRFHRWNGRVYVTTAVIISFTGFYLTWIRGSSGVPFIIDGAFFMDIAITINGILIILFAGIAIRYAMARNFAVHRKWALRLFMVVSGVWFFRVGLMLWLLIHQRPAGFDPATFQGSFLTFLSFAQYLLPLLFLEIYFWAQERAGQTGKIGTAVLIAVLTIAMGAGIFGATMGMWLPNIY